MEHEPIKYPDDDVEDGEISADDSDDGYTPLQRPELNTPANVAAETAITKMEEASEQDESLPEQSSDSSDSESGCNSKNNKMTKIRANLLKQLKVDNAVNAAKNKKYNIWSNGLQEESLMENLKGCGVDKSTSNYDRSCESYDYSLKYRMNEGAAGPNKLKRRQSHSDDSLENQNNMFSDDYEMRNNKRFRANSMNSKRGNVRSRLGTKSDDSSSNDGSSAIHRARYILDLNEITEDKTNETVARDLSNKLYEENDELMLRIVNVLGTKLPHKIFKETQKIESEGGMLIMNGARRRTPGGVFLFLLKKSDELLEDQKKLIFINEMKKSAKDQKLLKAMKRDRKVEQLKQTLQIENDLLTTTRSEFKAETHANLSNPPPSPVTDCNRENSSDFDTHDIHHVNVTSPEKSFTHSKQCTANSATASALSQNVSIATGAVCSYDEDFLDMNCDDNMDLF